MVSPSYFPAIAAVELGYFSKEGLEATIELLFPVTKTYEALRDGGIDFVIGAAPGPADGLKRMLVDSGIDPERDVNIAAVPATAGVSFGLAAAKALEKGAVDGFWANGMAAEIALRGGLGTLVIDARRGDGPKASRHYTFPALVTTQKWIDQSPGTVAAAVRAVVAAQAELKRDPSLAAAAAKRHFPAAELALIAELVRRDAPYYDPRISRDAVDSLNTFARATGLLSGAPAYERVVATRFQSLWSGTS